LASYVVQRLFNALLVLLLVLTLLVVVVRIVPGDPVRKVLGPRATPEAIQELRQELGLNDSPPEQVATFISRTVRGDLGNDFVTGVPVRTYVQHNLPNTLVLAAAALLLTLALGIPLGVYSATHPNSAADRLLSVASIGILTIPAYVAGLLLLYVFAIRLKWLPAIGAGEMSDPVDYARHLALPTVALALSWVGYVARLLRVSMVEVLGTNYVRTARAFGLSERRVTYRYALKNAIIPTVAILGIAFGTMMGSAIFVEIVFGRSGLGAMVYQAILDRNYPVIRGGVLTLAVFFIAANLISDLVNHALDPRIRRAA
jgi:peptide/nickel transport system permease protein